MYFRLNPECYLIRGKKNGAIFDLIDEETYALNQNETEIVAYCEDNNSINRNKDFLRELKRLCLGNFYSRKVYISRLRVGSPDIEQGTGEPPEFNRAFLEINNLCNRDCWFCGYYGIKRTLGCLGCNKWNESGDPVTIERWMNITDELQNLGCKDIYIKGGDLTLARDKTLDILDYASKKFNNIYVTIHEQGLTDSITDDLANNAKLIVQTENPVDISSPNIIMLLTLDWERYVDMSEIQSKNTLVDFIIKDKTSLMDGISLKGRIAPNMYRFLNNIRYHPCLGHTIAISNTGNVLPCPMMRNHAYGNIKNRELYSIFREKWDDIDNVWQLNLDKIDKCTSCEFRYVCNDCRALEEGLTGRLSGKITCGYDPEGSPG